MEPRFPTFMVSGCEYMGDSFEGMIIRLSDNQIGSAWLGVKVMWEKPLKQIRSLSDITLHYGNLEFTSSPGKRTPVALIIPGPGFRVERKSIPNVEMLKGRLNTVAAFSVGKPATKSP
ncbi:hypothetical protein [Desulfonatronum thioautotrophicum]|uniref:hypothetical protein n=1 Tax=Desulfonatronum thioautotrophicum TaxID=617001 RepID=UPI001427D04E|nr:hypothetical protein [Desulfonatronum thioautotrophicum]